MKKILTAISLFFSLVLFSQVDQRQVDSLNKIVAGNFHDSIKFNALSDLNWMYMVSDPPKAREFALKEIILSQKLSPIYKAQAFNDLSIAYIRLTLLDSGLIYTKKAYDIRKKLGRKDLMASSLSKLGSIYTDQGKFTEALKSNLEALKIYEDMNDKIRLGLLYNNVGQLYEKLNRNDLVKFYCEKSLAMCKSTGNQYGTANTLANLASCYFKFGDRKKPFQMLKEVEEIYLKFGDSLNLAAIYNNLGHAHRMYGNKAEGKKYYEKAIDISRKINNLPGLVLYLYNLSLVIKEEGNYAEAVKLANEALAFTSKSDPEQKMLNYRLLATLCAYTGKPKEAENYIEKYVKLSDSVFTKENAGAMAKLQTVYESEKQGLEIKNLEKDKALQVTEIKKRNATILAIGVGLILSVVLGIVVLRSYRLNKKAGVLISQQKQHVELQRDKLQIQNAIIEEKKKEILDSINYAQRIQTAILPPIEEIQKQFPESFVFYKPKDIVAGDFYWMEVISKKGEADSVLIAVADCTGHGVPGAFMSLLGKENLDKSLIKSTSPAGILIELNKNIRKALKQNTTGKATRDGMDIALVKIQGNNLWYSGAMRPLWIKRKNVEQIEEIRATKAAIAGFTEDSQIFDEHEVKLEKGDTVYLFTDGYPDQFGGEKQKKLTSKRFKEILQEQSTNDMYHQKEYLMDFIANWFAGEEQIDDILVIGIKI